MKQWKYAPIIIIIQILQVDKTSGYYTIMWGAGTYAQPQ